MEKIFTSLKLPGIFILLTSAMSSYWNYPALETYDYPKNLIEVQNQWYESPLGIFAVSFSSENETPTVSAPADLQQSTDAGVCTASISIPSVTYTGNSLTWTMSGATTGSGSGQPGTLSFEKGITVITFTAHGDNDSTAQDSMQITVTDEENPDITLGNAISQTTDAGQCTASINIPNATFSDNCNGSSIAWNLTGATSGSGNGQIGAHTFNIGTTTINYTVTDAAGNTTPGTLSVEVTDNEDPILTLGNAISQTTDAGQCTASVNIPDATFSDNCNGSSISWNLTGATTGSGNGQIGAHTFNIGTTTINYNVTDASGNSITASVEVTVSDQEKPVISAGENITVSNISGQCYAGITIPEATASDNCSVGTPTGTRSDGQPLNATYPVGTTRITWTVTDANGNDAVAVEQVVTVEDTEAPQVPELEDIVWGCQYTFEIPTTIDNCDNVITATTSQSTTFTTSGEITWIFTDSAQNITTAIQKITIDPVQIEAEAIDHVLCNGHATGSIKVAASGGVGPYTYAWESLGAGDTKTDLSAGTYSVKAFDVNGCETQTLEVTINEPATFVDITDITTTSGCFQQNNGTATVQATGGTGGYTYLWSNGQTAQQATGLAPGTHSVTVTDENGCSKNRQFTISAPTELKIIGFQTTETTSYGSATGTATVQISGGTPNYSFSWSNGQTEQTARNLAAGEYTVTVTDANGCTTSKEVTIIDSLTANILPISVCEDGSVVRVSYFEVEDGTAKGGTAPYSYSWNFGENASPATAEGAGRHRISYTHTGEKLITLTVTDNEGRTFTESLIQNVGGCFSDDCGSNDLGVEDYFVGDGNQNRITSENCAATEEKFIYINLPTEPDRYSLYVELVYSVQSLSDENNIRHYKVEGCFYQKQAIPDLAKTFSIEYSCGDIVKIEGIYLTFQNNINRECGTTQGNGNHPKCYSTNNEASVRSPLYAIAFPNNLLCNGGNDGIINTRSSGGTGSYTYELISAANDSTVRTAQPSSSFTGLSAGRYKVIVSDTEGESFTTSEVEIEQPLSPLKLELSTQVMTTCYGGTDGSATVVASGGTPDASGQYTYVWEGIGQTTPTATNLAAGTYTVRVLDTYGCEISLPVTIEQPEELNANAGPDQVLACGNNSTTLAAVFEPETVEGEDAPQGTWSIVNGPAGGIIENVNDPHSKFTGNVGTYTLRWSVPCGATDDVKISLGSCTTLDFDGQDDHIVIGDKFDLPSNFTLEAWVKQDPAKTSGIKTILSERDNSSLSAGGFDLIIDNNIPKFRWNGSTIASTYPIGTDRWYHIAVILGGEHAGLYVDGIKVSDNQPGQPSPTSNPFLIGASYNSATPTTPENYFHGWIEEVRIWKKALNLEQLRFLMNQRLDIGTSPLKGTALPLPVPGSLDSGNDLLAYYPLIVTEITNGTTKDKGPNAFNGRMVNIISLQENTAPLPYLSARNGEWIADETWLRPAVWDHPNSLGIDGTTLIDWNIVVTNHNISSQAKDITVLGLRSEAGRLTIANPSGAQNETNSGQKLRVSHYLLLNGVIDLVGESQLLQDEGSILASSSSGYLERDQQGTASSYNYNYWTSPVSPGINTAFSIKGVMKDGTITTYRDLNFGNQYHFADGPFTNPRRVSNYWLHKFHGTANNYFSWNHIGSTGTLAVGEGFSMKGTSGYASGTELQNYTFVGLPNNGTIELTINETPEGENYLIGNPYPSSIDADKFITDNIVSNNNASSAFNGSLYFWDHFAKTDHYLQHYIGGYAVYNLSGAIEPASSVDSRIDNSDPSRTGSKRPGDYIPVGQAFFVNTVIGYEGEQVISTGGEKIVFRNSQRIYKREGIDKNVEGKDQVVFFSTNRKELHTSTPSENVQEQQKKIWIKFKSPAGYHRQLLVTADKRTTSGFDLGFDAPLIDNNKEDMYWLMGNAELVIQGVPDFALDRALPLGIKTAEGGKFIISIDDLENVEDDFAIFVKDNQNNSYHNLQNSDFTANVEKGSIHDRYSIVFNDGEEPDQEEEEDGDETGEEGNSKDGEDGEGDTNEGGDGDVVVDKPQQPIPTPPGIELLYSAKNKEVVIKNEGLLPVEKAILYNSLGQQIHIYNHLSPENQIELPVQVPTMGMYFIRVYVEDSTSVLKFLVE